jgi:catechol 2,3-dioxygenase-like lactoylglutathione lyase family enzyme
MSALGSPVDSSSHILRGRLHHLQILSPDPESLAEFYGRCLEMTVSAINGQWLCQGPQRGLIVAPGIAGGLGYAAYAVADLAALHGLRKRLIAANVAIEPFSNPLFEPGSIQFSDPDGHRFVFGLPRNLPNPAAPALPGRLQHVVLASADADRMLSFYRDVVGFRLSDRVIDDAGALRTCFLRTDHEHHSLAIFQADEIRLDHHCYEAANWNSIRDWGDHFASLRLPVQWGPGRHGPGNNLFVFVHDPDGNWIEISAEMELVSPDRPVGTWPHEERTLNSWGRGALRS